MAMKRFILTWLFALAIHSSFAQMLNIVIDSSGGSPNEPCIAIDPKNTNHMVAGSNINNYYVSSDGGYTWSKGLLTSTYGVWGDPVTIADTTGTFYYFHLARNPAITTWPDYADRIVCQRMDTFGLGWTNGTFTGHLAPAMQDKHWVVVDRNTNTMYVTWTQFDKYASTSSADSSNILFSKSADQGNTWSTPMRLNKEAGDCMDEDFTVEGAVPCVGLHGEVFVAWCGYNKILFDRSYDGGITWMDSDKLVASVPGGWDYNVPGLNRCNGLSFIACDLSSGPYSGALYISWSDQKNGSNNTDVWICKSIDSGKSWSIPLLVNDDFTNTHQFMSSMSVDPSTGYVYVLFYDRRNYGISIATDVYLAVSKDGGATFTNHLISESPFVPNPGDFFGDYTYVSAFNGMVRPIWGRYNTLETFKQKIVTAIIDSTITGPPPPPVNAMANATKANFGVRIYPNPVSGAATISYELAVAGNVSIYIADITGRSVMSLKDGAFLPAGRHIERVGLAEAGLSPGLYFLCVKNATANEIIKMVFKP
jgi:hypothetical protein